MDPITIVTAVNSALTLAEALIPQVKQMFERGEISAEQQREVLARYESLKQQANGEFSGPAWEIQQ